MAKHTALASRLKSPNSHPGVATAHIPAPVKRSGGHGATKQPAPTHASTGGPHQAQIQSEAALRFGPQADALGALLRQAIADRDQGIAVQKSTGTGLLALASRAQPAVANIEAAGATRMAQPYQDVSANLAGLSPNADPIKAAVARDYALASANQVQDATAAAAELKQRQVDALSGRQAGIGAVQAQYAVDKGKIADQASSLAGQQGAYTSSRLAALLADDAKTRNANRQAALGRKQSNTNSLRSSGIDPATGKPIPGGKLDPRKQHGKVSATGAKLQSADKHDSAREKLAVGLRTLAELDPQKGDRHHTAPGLVAGAPAVSGQQVFKVVPGATPGTTKQERVLGPGGVPQTSGDLPAIPALGQWATVAADVYYDGHLSRANQVKLAKAGYSIKQLGLPTYAEWKRTHPSNTKASLGSRGSGSVT
jgi:hypothetical protein